VLFALLPLRRRRSEPIIGAIRGPERAYYQRLSGEFSKAVRELPLRRARVRGPKSQMVVTTAAGEIGFLTNDPAGWTAAVNEQLAVRLQT